MRRFAYGAALAVLAINCSPGFSYVAPGAVRVKDEQGVGYVVNLSDGVVARFQGGAGTNTGAVGIRILNRGEAPLAFAPTPMAVWDANGKRLETRHCRYTKLVSPWTRMETSGPEILRKGQAMEVGCNFPVIFRGGFRTTWAPESKRISLAQPGFSQGGRPLDIRATLVAE